MTIGEVQSLISKYRQIQQDCDDKIARLRPVYNELGNIKSSFRSARKGTETIFDKKGTWRGDTHTSFCTSGAELDSLCGNYYQRLDEAQDKVNLKIKELQAKKMEMIPIINDLMKLLAQLIAEMENIGN